MIAITFKFLAGRYHATPWGRHVNEGAVEWPPSPWRILRALVATWKRTLPDLPQEQIEPILRKLAGVPPEFELPPASTGHTRHYMPWHKGWKPEEPEKAKTLVFDTFVVVPRNAALVVHWPSASLDDRQRLTLEHILANLSTLGRSESWCEAALLPDDTDSAINESQWRERRVKPLNGGAVPKDHEIVRLLCPDAGSAFADNHVVAVTTKTTGRGRNKQTIQQRTTIHDPAWNICMETIQLHKERWSDPPGSRWVQYVRPRDCFKVQPSVRILSRSAVQSHTQVVRYALDSTVLPLVTETLPIADAARRHLMGLFKRIELRKHYNGRIPDLLPSDAPQPRSRVFSGKEWCEVEQKYKPVKGHGHAYYLPTDEDGDGRLDHLTVFARDGFNPSECAALDQLRELRMGRPGEERHSLRLLLLGMGAITDYHPGPLGDSKNWVCVTPYIATRYAKTRGRDRIDTSSQHARVQFLVNDLRDQIQATLADLPDCSTGLKVEPMVRGGAFTLADRWRPIQFKRFRSKPSDDGGRRLTGAFRVKFPIKVRGPIALGYSSHFGMGLFMPITEE